jgi:thioester reductase-like protein
MSDATFFVTGYPGFIGKRLVAGLYRQRPGARIFLLVQPKYEDDARAEVAKLGPREEGRVVILTGDIVDMHLGLSSTEYRTLTENVTEIFHLAALYHHGSDKGSMRTVNVDGTRNVLELGADCRKLKRFNHMSTSLVSGVRVGVIAEDELVEGQKFRSAYEESKYEAEVLVERAKSQLPISIYRPGIVVGDSRTGEIDRFDGPYYLAILLVTSPVAVPLPLPGSAVAPLNVVPVDYVVDAMLHISQSPEGVGKTFHLVDPNPVAARRVYEWIAKRTGKKLPPIRLSYRLADTLLQIPLLERLVREERAAIASVNHLAIYNCNNTLELLDGTGIRCPQLTTYLERLVSYVQEYYEKKKTTPEAEAEDPLRETHA